MNNRMWENPIAKENVAKLEKLGYRFIGPDSGWLACRNTGPGRLADP
jgi:phosphopantothenoylcysteine decarboxylase/phosphopantothenate--cysteine ligase